MYIVRVYYTIWQQPTLLKDAAGGSNGEWHLIALRQQILLIVLAVCVYTYIYIYIYTHTYI